MSTEKKPRILIAEDEDFLSKVLAQKLKREGFDVDVADNGEKALASMRKTLPDVVLLDLMMPKKNGFDVLKEMQGDEQLSQVPVLVLSNMGQGKDIDEAKALGARDYFVKSETDMKKIIPQIQKLIS